MEAFPAPPQSIYSYAPLKSLSNADYPRNFRRQHLGLTSVTPSVNKHLPKLIPDLPEESLADINDRYTRIRTVRKQCVALRGLVHTYALDGAAVKEVAGRHDLYSTLRARWCL
jgi:hypothetical protein